MMQRLFRFVDDRLIPSYILQVAGAIVVLTVTLQVLQFDTSNQGQTAFGVPLGGDFSGFYVAAQILNQHDPKHLYDRGLHQRLYHELLPAEHENVAIPYVHPPFVAGLIRPLAWSSYPVAVAIWSVVSAILYLISVEVLRRTIPSSATQNRWLVLIVALSFEPFAMECWVGGQLSAIAFLSFALGFAALHRSKPVLAGLALGLCFYKPTLLILVLPMLVIGGRWKVLLGMSITGILLVFLSIALVGWDVSQSYVNELISFSKSTSNGEVEIRNWKYVDLNNCLHLIMGRESPLRLKILSFLAAIPFLLLARLWWRSNRADETAQQELWATTLTWVPVLNLYVGIYDSILVVQSVLITSSSICNRRTSERPLIDSGFAYLAVWIYAAPWFSQNLAAVSGISVYTLLLIVCGLYQIGRCYGLLQFRRRKMETQKTKIRRA